MLNVSEVNAERSSEALPERATARFSEMLISPYVKERLAATRFITPTPVQAAAIPQALEGKDVLATAQTGTGKTLAFLIPVIEQLLKDKTPGIAALVLVPTRELAMQVVEQYNALRGKQLLPAALVVGGLSEGAQLQAIRKGARLVVATPGRLEDYLDRRLFHFSALRVLILDEADRMLDMGFLPAIKRIVSILPKERQTMRFSATLEGDMPGVCTDQARNRAHRREPQSQGLCRRHDSWRPLTIATHCGAHRIPARTLPRAGGDGPGFTRYPRTGHRSRHQLRSTRGGREFHSSRWANRTQRRSRCGFHAVRERAAVGTPPTRALAGHQDRADARG